MKPIISLFCLFALLGCVATPQEQAHVEGKRALIPSDIELVRDFLDALYRPGQTLYRVTADADSEEAVGDTAGRNRKLSARMQQLRIAPSQTITVNLYSGDRPEPWGSDHFLYLYDRRTGGFTVEGPHALDRSSADMWIDVRHWPNGTRLVNLSNTWIDDFKDSIFHLRLAEKTFRLAIAIEPVD